MIINRYGLLYSLFSLINRKNESDIDYVLAEYLLSHYNEIGDLNIYDFAEDCHVSRSTIRRFCESIGFQNFAKMKNEFKKYDDQYKRINDYYHQENFTEFLATEINHMIDGFREIPEKDIDKIASTIYKKQKIVFLTTNVGVTSISNFQQGMLFNNKVIHVISDNFDNHPLLNSLGEDDLIIVLSGTAGLAKRIIPSLKHTPAEIMLLTMKNVVTELEKYCDVYYISQQSGEEVSLVYLTYGYSFFLDLLLAKYVEKYV